MSDPEISQPTAREMLATLKYLIREFEQFKEIDAINMRHAYDAVAVARAELKRQRDKVTALAGITSAIGANAATQLGENCAGIAATGSLRRFAPR